MRKFLVRFSKSFFDKLSYIFRNVFKSFQIIFQTFLSRSFTSNSKTCATSPCNAFFRHRQCDRPSTFSAPRFYLASAVRLIRIRKKDGEERFSKFYIAVSLPNCFNFLRGLDFRLPSDEGDCRFLLVVLLKSFLFFPFLFKYISV